MAAVPAQPRIYHITHVDNLPSILADGGIVSDAAMITRGGPAAAIGMSSIKRRRVEQLEVDCHPGTKVGEFVPFYFCPRSIMLYVIHRGNDPSRSSRAGTIRQGHAMIEYKTGDILAEQAEALVNTVNCVGVMGAGIALQFKRAFPANFDAYEAACRRRKSSQAACSCSRRKR